jgi:hypothetical protein
VGLTGGAGRSVGEGGARARGRWAAWATREGGALGEERWAGSGRAGGGKNFLFLFLFLLSLFSFEQIFSRIFLGVKNILCEVLLTNMLYAYDEMSYEVGFQEIIRGRLGDLGFLTLGLNFGMLQTYPHLKESCPRDSD